MSRRLSRRAFVVGGLLVLLATAWALEGCARHPPAPVIEPLRTRTERDPVILLPGLTGTELRNTESGKVAWGTAHRLLFPKDGGYGLALSLDPSVPDPLEASAPIYDMRLLGVVRRPIYSPILSLMQDHGYVLGDLERPADGGSFFFFVYDWRYGLEDSVALLAEQLQALRRARGDRDLRVNLICQSNACRIARYLVKYGPVGLEEAEAAHARRLDGVTVNKLIQVGTSAGGSLRILRELELGRRYVGALSRHIQPETIFTFRSLFEILPVYRDDLFFDVRGETMDVDLFDPGNWRRFGWSVFAPEVEARLARRGREDLFGDAAARERYLETMLDRARRMHLVLHRDVEGFMPPRYYSIQNAFHPTPDRALLVEHDGRWRTLFLDDKEVQRDPFLRSLAASPGDGHGTLASQRWWSSQELEALAHPTVFVEGGHFSIILNPACERRILEFLAE